MKQSIVIKLSSPKERTKSRAKKEAVTFSGVSSLQIIGQNLVVIGEGVDSLKLMKVLKKKVDSKVELLSVSPSPRENHEHYINDSTYGYDQNQHSGFDTNYHRNSFELGPVPMSPLFYQNKGYELPTNYGFDEHPRTPLWSYNGNLGYYPTTPRVYEIHHLSSPDHSSCSIM